MKKLFPLISDFPLQTLNEAIALRVFCVLLWPFLFMILLHRPYRINCSNFWQK